MSFDAADAPAQIQRLPRDADGTPVPWGIRWTGSHLAENRRPDWGEIDRDRFSRAIVAARCFICGEHFRAYHGEIGREATAQMQRGGTYGKAYHGEGTYGETFLLNARECLERRSRFPAAHAECAAYVARRPLARIGPLAWPPGEPIAVWRCRGWECKANRRGMTIELTHPLDLFWIVDGRAAARAEVEKAIEGADKEAYPPKGSGLKAVAEYEDRMRLLKRWLPDLVTEK